MAIQDFKVTQGHAFLRATTYMLLRAYANAILSVSLSVTWVIHAKTVEVRIMRFSPYSSPLFLRGKFHPEILTGPLNGSVKQGWGRKNSQFSANNSPYLRNGAR